MRCLREGTDGRHQRRGRGAFTLIELLVVVGILSLLMAILVPSLSNARSYARSVLCTTHVRQIGSAWQLYLFENKESFPRYQQNMQWFYGGQHPAIVNKDSRSPYALRYRPLNPYADMALKDQAVGSGLFQCPAGREIPGVTEVREGEYRGVHNVYDYFGNCYMMNWLLLVPPKVPGEKRTKTFQMKHIGVPHGKLVLAGDCQWYYTVNDAKWDANFHNDNDEMAVVFMDTHAVFMKLTRGESKTEDYIYSPVDYDEDDEEGDG